MGKPCATPRGSSDRCDRLGVMSLLRCRIVAHIRALAWNRMKPTMSPSPIHAGWHGRWVLFFNEHRSREQGDMGSASPLKGDTGSSELAPAALQVTGGLRVSRQSLCPCVLLPIALRCPLFSLMMYTMYIYKHTHIAFSIPLPGLATPHVVVFISWSAFVS